MKFVVVGFWIFVIAAIFAAAASVPTWLLWNWLVPDLFGLPHVSLLQAFGLLLLSGFLSHDWHIAQDDWLAILSGL